MYIDSFSIAQMNEFKLLRPELVKYRSLLLQFMNSFVSRSKFIFIKF